MNNTELFNGVKVPLALSEEETLKYLNRYKNGDMDAKNKLVVHNIRLVILIARRYYNKDLYPRLEFEDLIMTGIEGLIKGVNTYNFDRDVKLISYASKCINNQILMYLRKLKKDKITVNLEKIIETDDEGNDFKLEDICLDYKFDYLYDYIKNDDDKKINEIIDELSERDREIIKLHFGFYGDVVYTQREIANKLDISQSYVSRKVKDLSKKLKRKMIERDIYY